MASAPGSIGKNRPWSRKCSLSCLAGDAGLDDAIEILGMDGEHAVHVAEIEADAAVRRVDLALERGAGAEGDHRNALCRADAHDLLHVFGGVRKHHRIGRLVGDPGQRIAVLLAHRREVTRRLPTMAASAAITGLDRVAVASEFLPGFRSTPSRQLFGRSGRAAGAGQVWAMSAAMSAALNAAWFLASRAKFARVAARANRRNDDIDAPTPRSGTGLPRSLRVPGDAGGAGLDRLERPPGHGLLQCAVRPRGR